MTKLTDLMHADPQTVHHSFFPGRHEDDVEMEWHAFWEAFRPELSEKIEVHCNTVPLPTDNNIHLLPVLPHGFMHYLAGLIDTHLPHWNLVQRAALYELMLTECWETGRKLLGDIMSGKEDPTETKRFQQNN